MNVERFFRTIRAASPPIVAMVAILARMASTPCAAQAPAPPPPPQRLPVPSVNPFARPATPPAAALPPSTVSSAIQRFASMSGAGQAPPGSPAAAANPDPAEPTANLPAIKPMELPDERALPPLPAAAATSAPARPLLPNLPPATPGGRAVEGTAGPAPSVLNLKFKPAPLEDSDFRFPINLATALRLADARPLMVAAAQATVWVAEAELTRAKVLWIPSVVFGLDYIRHDGGGPDFNKGVMTFPSTNFFYGGPGLYQYVNITDAYYEPLIARQELTARHFNVQTAKNDSLMQTADAYFMVHQYRGMYAGALYTVERGKDLVERVNQLSKELVPKVEVDRARNMLADMEQLAVMARQQWRVNSANLTQVLRLDPRAVVVPQEHDHAQITLIDPTRSLDDLMAVALNNRPEIASRRASVEAAAIRIQREKRRPFLPLFMLNGFQSAGMYIQYGLFGLGPNSSINQWRGRDDVNVQLIWQLENFGFGNLARIKNQRSNESKAIIELRNAQDTVAADVTRALARVQSAAARVLQADRALRTGLVTFEGHLEGLQQTRRLGDVLVLTFRPQEAVYSLELLNVAFQEYFTTVAEYNRAQFDLYHAVGYPAHELAALKTAGELLPVNLDRPAFLPPVGNGPPPATR